MNLRSNGPSDYRAVTHVGIVIKPVVVNFEGVLALLSSQANNKTFTDIW